MLLGNMITIKNYKQKFLQKMMLEKKQIKNILPKRKLKKKKSIILRKTKL